MKHNVKANSGIFNAVFLCWGLGLIKNARRCDGLLHYRAIFFRAVT